MRMPLHELHRGISHGSEAALHVGRATAVQRSIADDWRKGITLPLRRVTGGHDVGMPGEAKHRTACAMPGPQIADLAKWHGLDPEASPA